MNQRIVLKTGQIRAINRILRNWAKETESDSLALLYESSQAKTDRGDKAILKGSSHA